MAVALLGASWALNCRGKRRGIWDPAKSKLRLRTSWPDLRCCLAASRLDIHAEVQAHAGQHFLDLVQRLAAEVRGAQHLGFGLLDQVADVDDVVVLQAVGRTDRQLQLVDLLQQKRVELQTIVFVRRRGPLRARRS